MASIFLLSARTDQSPPKIPSSCQAAIRGSDITPLPGNHGYTYFLLAKISTYLTFLDFPFFFFTPSLSVSSAFLISLSLLQLTLFSLSCPFLLSHLFPSQFPCCFNLLSVHSSLSFMSSLYIPFCLFFLSTCWVKCIFSPQAFKVFSSSVF